MREGKWNVNKERNGKGKEKRDKGRKEVTFLVFQMVVAPINEVLSTLVPETGYFVSGNR